MAEASNLKLEAVQLGQEIAKKTDLLASLEQKVNDLPSLCARSKIDKKAAMERSFRDKQDSLRLSIKEICKEKRKEVEALLDSFPGLEHKEYSGKFEVKEIEAILEGVYPKEFIAKYIPLKKYEYADDTAAFKDYAFIQKTMVMVGKSNLSGSVYHTLTNLLNSAANFKDLGGKVFLVIAALSVFLLIFIPFLFITIYSVIGTASAVYGMGIRIILDKLYSIKSFLNETYDEDIFTKDKNDILEEVDSFLYEVELSYTKSIDERKFTIDEQVYIELDEKFDIELKKTKTSIELENAALKVMRDRMTVLVEELEREELARQNAAAEAVNRYIGKVDWKMEWLPNILINVTPDNKVIAAKWDKCNGIFYSRKIEQLQHFSKLVLLQNMLHMHPNYLTQIVLDYKYMAGELTQFTKLLPVLCDIRFDQDDIDRKIESITLDLRSRVKTILQTCSGIDEFNKVMAEYESPGESYVLVHVFGVSALSPALRNFLKNGPKVGYFFKLYLTITELRELKDDFPFEDLTEFGEITDTVTLRTSGMLRRIMNEE